MTSSTFYRDGFRDAETNQPMSPPDIPVYAMEYRQGYSDAARAYLERRDNLVALINTYNEASSPSVPRTDEEHAIERERAKVALGSIRRNYVLNVDYKELSNGALWPVRS